MKKCCGNCKWHQRDDKFDDWVCCNGDSEYVADYTDYDHCCEDWEELQ